LQIRGCQILDYVCAEYIALGYGRCEWRLSHRAEHTRDSRGAFTPDKDAVETLPAGSTVDDLIDRMIAILQEAAGNRQP
jgi:hypothetical protein